MTSALPKKKYSPQEYLAMEREAPYKSEYYDGEIFAMAGGSRNHNLIVTNLLRKLSALLEERPCEVYASDMRVKVSQSGLYTYPDVSVMCGKVMMEEDAELDTLLNPILLVEVLSDSTEAYARGEKFAQYRRIESLREYVLISQDQAGVEQFIRQEKGKWLYVETNSLDATARLHSIEVDLPLAEVYKKVEFK